MTPLILLIFLLVHWIADFILQSDAQAKGKSTSNKALLSHTICYSACWIFPILLLTNPISTVIFVLITFIAHTITDYFTSRLNSYLYKKGDIHNFFVSVGFDQILHYLQLYFTYLLILTF